MFDFHGHPFWWILCAAVVVWYSTITVYVAARGAKDVRGMLERLGRGDERGSER